MCVCVCLSVCVFAFLCSDMTVRDAEGRSALHLAVETNSDYALSIAVALVDKGLHTGTQYPLLHALECFDEDPAVMPPCAVL